MRVYGLTALFFVLVGVARPSPQFPQFLFQPYQNPWQPIRRHLLVPVYSRPLPSSIAAPPKSSVVDVAPALAEEDPFAPDEDDVSRDAPVIGVIGGTQVPHGRFPAHAVITKVYGGTNIGFSCGGSLITRRHVLTAAHCTNFGNLEDIRVYFNTASRDPLDSGMRVRAVKKFWPHPDYKPLQGFLNPENDIAILLLDAPVTYIRPVRLAMTTESFENSSAIVYGFGVFQSFDPFDNSNRPSGSNFLRSGSLDIISNEECSAKMGLNPESNIDQYICTKGQQGSCEGDSGGPLLVGSRQVGVVSFGPLGCKYNTPFPTYSVFMRVGFYADWIRNITSQDT